MLIKKYDDMVCLIKKDNIAIFIEIQDYIPSYDHNKEPESIVTRLFIWDTITKEVLYKNDNMFCNYDYICKKSGDILYLATAKTDIVFNSYRDRDTKYSVLILDKLTRVDCTYEIGLKRIKREEKKSFFESECIRLDKENKALKDEIEEVSTNKGYIIYYDGLSIYIIKANEIEGEKLNKDTIKFIFENDRYKEKYIKILEYKEFSQENYCNKGEINDTRESLNFMLKDVLIYLNNI